MMRISDLIFQKVYAACPGSPGPDEICGAPLPNNVVDDNYLQTGLSIFFAILGSVAFLIIVIAGLRYIAAAGDPQKTANAKNTIIYALLGLCVAILAQAIVAFTVKSL